MKMIEILINDDPPLDEMASLHPSETGLNQVLWIGRVGGSHGPRIKVSNITHKWRANDNFTLSLEPNPLLKTPSNTVKISKHEYNKVVEWIKLNYDDLMILWWMFEHNAIEVKDLDTDTVITMDEIFDRLQRV